MADSSNSTPASAYIVPELLENGILDKTPRNFRANPLHVI